MSAPKPIPSLAVVTTDSGQPQSVSTEDVVSLAHNGANYSIDPPSPERFINRELSWLAFNRRALEEAQNLRHPLLARLGLLSISASNLDEFYMVRVAGLKGMVNAGVATLSDDGLTPAQQLSRVDQMAGELVIDQQKTWRELRSLLGNAGIVVIEPSQLAPDDKAWLDE